MIECKNLKVDVHVKYWQKKNALLNKLRLEDTMGFWNFTRLKLPYIEYLTLMVEWIIMKQGTKFRETIPTSIRLIVTVRFPVNAGSFTSLMYTFWPSQYRKWYKSTISKHFSQFIYVSNTSKKEMKMYINWNISILIITFSVSMLT